MATGDTQDFQSRLIQTLPRWFGDYASAPLISALLTGLATSAAFIYSLIAYLRLQTRIATATDGNLDMIAGDFFGTTLARRAGQTDANFRALILASLLRERGTRAGMLKILLDLTARVATIVEFTRPLDTGAVGQARIAYLNLTGAAGNFGSSPNAAANQIVGSIDIRVFMAMGNWASGALAIFIGKRSAAGAAAGSYGFGTLTAGLLSYVWSDGTTVRQVDSTIPFTSLGLINTKAVWLRVTHNVATGAVSFYYSTDNTVWYQVGATQTTTVAAIVSSTAPVEIGSQFGGTGNLLIGSVYQAQIYNGIAGALAVNFEAGRIAAGATTGPMSTGETWTVNSTGATPAAVLDNAPFTTGFYGYGTNYYPDALVVDYDTGLIPKVGPLPLSFTRNLASYCIDFEGVQRLAQANEQRCDGMRREENLLVSASDVVSTQNVTVAAGTYLLVLGLCTGSAVLSGAATGTLAGSAANRKQLLVTCSAGTLTVTVTGSVLKAMLLARQGSSILAAPEYVANDANAIWPFNGWGVRGVKYFAYPNLNLVDVNGNITEVSGVGLASRWLYAPGRVSNFASTPDSAAISITGDIQCIVCAALANWASGVAQTLMSKFFGGSSSAYSFDILGSGRLNITMSTTGSDFFQAFSSVGLPGINGAAMWLQFTRRQSDGRVQFFYSFQPPTTPITSLVWTKLGTDLTLAPGSAIFDGIRPLCAMAGDNGTVNPILGRMFRGQIYNGIGGVLVADFDPTRFTVGGTTAAMTTGETWTVNTSGTGNLTAIQEAFTASANFAQPSFKQEDAAIQLLFQSGALTTGPWGTTAATPTLNSIMAPDGTTTGLLLVEDNTSNEHKVAQAINKAASAIVYTFGFWVKKRDRRYVLVYVLDASINCQKLVDLDNGSISTLYDPTSASIGHTITPGPNGWFLVTSTFTSGANATLVTQLAMANSSGTTSNYLGDGVSGNYFWLPQVVAGRNISSGIISAAGTVTRPGDLLLWDNGGQQIVANGEGYAYIEAKADNWATMSYCRLIGSGASFLSGTPLCIGGGATLTTVATQTYDNVTNANGAVVNPSGGFIAAMSSWKGATASAYTNNTAGSPAAFAGNWGVTQISIGVGGGFNWQGNWRRLKIARRQPPAAMLAAMQGTITEIPYTDSSGATGCYGSITRPYECLVNGLRPSPANGLTDADLYAAIDSAKPAATIPWTQLSN